jgi:hypothetical protein
LEEGGGAVDPLWRKVAEPSIRFGGRWRSRRSASEESEQAVGPLQRTSERRDERITGRRGGGEMRKILRNFLSLHDD